MLTPFITAPAGVHRGAPQRHWCHPDTPGQNSVVTPSLVKRLFKPRHPSRLCGFHPIQLSSFITTPNFLPVVCWGAPQQGLWPPRYPLTPNTHPGYTGVHPISIGLHPGRMGCTPGDIWTPAGAVMKGVKGHIFERKGYIWGRKGTLGNKKGTSGNEEGACGNDMGT